MPDEESLSACTTLGQDADAGGSQDAIPAANSVPNPQGNEDGYEGIAALLAEHPTHAVFRQFGFLNALNLLYYQAELTQLEIDLCEAAKLDKISTDSCRQDYFRYYKFLSIGATDSGPTPEGAAQWKLVLKLRRTLKAYSRSILIVTTDTTPDDQQMKPS